VEVSHHQREPFYRYSDSMIVCPRCKEEYKVTLPQPIWAFSALFKGFVEEHKDCEEKEE